MEPSRRDVLIVAALALLGGCDKFFGLTGDEPVDADTTPLVDGVLDDPDGPAPTACASGNPTPLLPAFSWYPNAALTAAVRFTSGSLVEYAASATVTIEEIPTTGYSGALQLADMQVSEPTLAADGTFLVAIKNLGNGPTFVVADKRPGTLTPPFGLMRQLHLRPTGSGTEVVPDYSDQLSPPTSTTPMRMMVRPDNTQIVEYEKTAIADTWVSVHATLATPLGMQSIDSATLSSDGLALTLVGAPALGVNPAILRATRATREEPFAQARLFYTVQGVGLSGAYASDDCKTLFYVQGRTLYVVH